MTINLKPRFRAVLYRLFPVFEFWRASKAINREAIVTEYEDGLELDGYSGDLKSFLATAEDSHRSELDRSNRLDSKAGNYLGNIGVVLSILSLTPILAVALGFDGQRITSGGPLGLVAAIIFGYAILALLLSAYYSAKALKMREYNVYFTSSELKDWLENGDPDKKAVIKDLLVCVKNNEIYNLEKNNAISVAGTFSRNGLIGIGLGIILTSITIFPFETVLTYIPCL